MHRRMKRADTPGRTDMLTLAKSCISIKKQLAVKLTPYAYQTDGGTHGNNINYFIHHIFGSRGTCYSSKTPTNANVQFYLGKEVQAQPSQVPPDQHQQKNDPLKISLPYDKYFKDPEGVPTFKLLHNLVFHNMAWGYTCFASAFAVFVSEKEIKLSKSQVLAKFNEVKTEDDWLKLDLPVTQLT